MRVPPGQAFYSAGPDETVAHCNTISQPRRLYSAQDADSDGEEGKYYLFTPEEFVRVLGSEQGEAFNQHFDITAADNFEGKNIPNLLRSDPAGRAFDSLLAPVYQYRKNRCALRLDDKILTAWNGVMIAALCRLYQASGNSLMAWNLVRLSQLASEEAYGPLAERQLGFLAADAKRYPAGYAMFLLALLNHFDPPPKITVVLSDKSEKLPLILLPEAAWFCGNQVQSIH